MYSRIIKPNQDKSFFLFGPRGTGKTTWLKMNFKKAIYIDLLEAGVFNDLLANPQRLEKLIPPKFDDFIIIDEVQRIPPLLNEAHRLIEKNGFKFILTGSSARKLKQKETNLLAGRALTYHLYPMTAIELGQDFSLENGVRFGHLPAIFKESAKKKYLESYVMTYLQQEVQQEGLTRNMGAFSRFLEAASFSQGSVLNMSEIARECAVHRKVVENYFSILEDLLIAYRLPVFTKKSKRRLIQHGKFYFFDVGVYRTIRPSGPFDRPEEIDGAALETLVFQEIKAINDYLDLGYCLYFWRTADQHEVDFILYGQRGLIAIEIKRTQKINSKHLQNLKIFSKEYPQARSYLLYGGDRTMWEDGIQIIPIESFLKNIEQMITPKVEKQ